MCPIRMQWWDMLGSHWVIAVRAGGDVSSMVAPYESVPYPYGWRDDWEMFFVGDTCMAAGARTEGNPIPPLWLEYAAGFWDEFHSWKLPHLGHLAWFYRNMHATWKDEISFLSQDAKGTLRGDCSPANLKALFAKFTPGSTTTSGWKLFGGVIAGIAVGWGTYHLWGRRSNPSISIHKINRI
jgi:hypothetical protein